jgi:hypothetical protein
MVISHRSNLTLYLTHKEYIYKIVEKEMKNKLCFYNFASTVMSESLTYVHLPCKLLLRIGTEKI